MADKKIFWDKGHGGDDPGAVFGGLLEKALVSKIIDYAMDYLTDNYTGFEQRVSRSGDQTLTLTQRTNAANKWGADVFVSAHINAGKGTGFESFIHPNAGAATAALQNVLHKEILNAMRTFDNSLTDRGQKKANHAVTRQTVASAVLTESLFIDRDSDVRLLKKEGFIKVVGEAHARGVAKHLGLPEKAKKPASNPAQSASTGLYEVKIFTGSADGADKIVTLARKLGFKDAYKVLKK